MQKKKTKSKEKNYNSMENCAHTRLTQQTIVVACLLSQETKKKAKNKKRKALLFKVVKVVALVVWHFFVVFRPECVLNSCHILSFSKPGQK